MRKGVKVDIIKLWIVLGKCRNFEGVFIVVGEGKLNI